MRDAGAHVNFEQPSIKRERLVELGKTRIDFTSESSAPKFRICTVAYSFQRIMPSRVRFCQARLLA